MKQIKPHSNYSKFFLQKRHSLQFGNVGIKVLSFSRLSNTQINTIIWLVQKKIKNYSKKNNTKIWFLIHSNLCLTTLSLESRMGKGKGSISTYAIFIKPGTILCEFDNFSLNHASNLFNFISKKFPGKLGLVSKFSQKI
uniref:Ribosomal protein L16 n=1 Tax=Campylaephora sungminbooi TaxID=1896769 RepID=A0A1B0ZEQ2_9FLOR|nr:ribosomal protein L16 [Campylaephora sungminbooi]